MNTISAIPPPCISPSWKRRSGPSSAQRYGYWPETRHTNLNAQNVENRRNISAQRIGARSFTANNASKTGMKTWKCACPWSTPPAWAYAAIAANWTSTNTTREKSRHRNRKRNEPVNSGIIRRGIPSKRTESRDVFCTE